MIEGSLEAMDDLEDLRPY